MDGGVHVVAGGAGLPSHHLMVPTDPAGDFIDGRRTESGDPPPPPPGSLQSQPHSSPHNAAKPGTGAAATSGPAAAYLWAQQARQSAAQAERNPLSLSAWNLHISTSTMERGGWPGGEGRGEERGRQLGRREISRSRRRQSAAAAASGGLAWPAGGQEGIT